MAKVKYNEGKVTYRKEAIKKAFITVYNHINILAKKQKTFFITCSTGTNTRGKKEGNCIRNMPSVSK